MVGGYVGTHGGGREIVRLLEVFPAGSTLGSQGKLEERR